MRFWHEPIFLSCAALICFVASGAIQGSSEDLLAKVDQVVVSAYQSASEKFPCKVKDRGKPKILRWQDVDRCLNDADKNVDWESLSRQLRELAEAGGFSQSELASAVEESLSNNAMNYEKVFSVKNIEVLLPLSNSLLRYLPADSLLDYPVFDKSGTRMGSFVGVYTFDKAGGLKAANTFRMSIFQYTDPNGEIHSAAEGGKVLLLDSFGIPWKGAMSQPGFRLPSDKLLPR